MVRVAPIKLFYNPRTLWFDPGDLDIRKGDAVVVTTARGTEFGEATGDVFEAEEADVKKLKTALKPVRRLATDEDVEAAYEMERRSAEALPVFKEMAAEANADMHPVSVEYLLDGDKAVFYFEAEERVDFRDLVRKLAAHFHVRIDMRQIGVRDEARMVGGLGHCGQELCCKRLGGEFCPVSIRMAKEQDLSLNPQKISGVCGRLMCCLRYEFDAYKDFKGRAPKHNGTVQTPDGPAKVVDLDVPREVVSLKLEGEKAVKVPLADLETEGDAVRPNRIGEEAWERATEQTTLALVGESTFLTSQFTGKDKLAQAGSVRRTGNGGGKGRRKNQAASADAAKGSATDASRKPRRRHSAKAAAGEEAPEAAKRKQKQQAGNASKKKQNGKKGQGQAPRPDGQGSARKQGKGAARAAGGTGGTGGNPAAKQGPRPGQKSSGLRQKQASKHGTEPVRDNAQPRRRQGQDSPAQDAAAGGAQPGGEHRRARRRSHKADSEIARPEVRAGRPAACSPRRARTDRETYDDPGLRASDRSVPADHGAGLLEAGKTGDEACFHMYFRDYPVQGRLRHRLRHGAAGRHRGRVLVLRKRTSTTCLRCRRRAAVRCSAGTSWTTWRTTSSLRATWTRWRRARWCSPTSPSCGCAAPSCTASFWRRRCSTASTSRRSSPRRRRACAWRRRAPPWPSSACAAHRASPAACGPAARPWWAAAPPPPTCWPASCSASRFRGRTRTPGSCRFPDELTAFREYARVMPKNCVLLVDTYDVEQGVRNAITVGLEMRERGERLAGIRIDSGDLAWLAKMARRMLDEAGLEDCGIVLSNDLDEHTIQSICDEGAQVASWGVGTKLACAYDQPTLGGVYKLSATRAAGEKAWRDCLKISESAAKLTVPGVLDVRRYYHEDGRIAGDMVYDVNAGVHPCETIIDPCDDLRQKQLAGKRHEALLHPLARAGKTVLAPEGRDALAAQARAKEGLATLDESQKRMLNPHSYPVGLERGLFERRRDLVAHLRGIA